MIFKASRTVAIIGALALLPAGAPQSQQLTPEQVRADARVKQRIENELHDVRLAWLLKRKAIAEGREPADPPVTPPGPAKTSVQYRSWDEGEIKICETYAGEISLLVCDVGVLDWKESFSSRAGHDAAIGMSDEDAYREALAHARTNSKEFMVSFSRDAWPAPRRSGLTMTAWDCTKQGAISCAFAGRQKSD